MSKSLNIVYSLVVDMKWICVIAIILFSLTNLSSQSEATVAKKATIESLTKQAQLIVHVRVGDRWSPQQRGSQGQIYTYSQLKVIDKWYGQVTTSELLLVQLGGSIGDLHLKVHGDALLKSGDEVILFLSVDPQNKLPVLTKRLNDQERSRFQSVHLISLAQGVFFIDQPLSKGQSIVRQNLDDLVFYQALKPTLDLALQPVRHPLPKVLTLARLKEKVLSLTQEKQSIKQDAVKGTK